MSALDRLQNTDISPKTAGISIGVLVLVLTLVVLGVKSFMGSSTTPVSVATEARVTTKHVSVDVKETTTAEKSDAQKQSSSDGDSDDGWKVVANRNIFKPIPQASSSVADNGGRPRFGGGSLPPMAISPLPSMPGMGGMFGGRRSRQGGQSHLAYTGLVNTPTGTFGLLEDTSSGTTKYVREGDSAFGVEVVEIDARSMSVDSDGQTVRLGIGENKSNVSTTTPPSTGTPPAAGTPAAAQTPQADQGATPSIPSFGSGRRGRRFGGGTGFPSPVQ